MSFTDTVFSYMHVYYANYILNHFLKIVVGF